jgi:hypothetical protein
MLELPSELCQLTIEQKLQRILELGDDALKEQETQEELTQMLSEFGTAESVTIPSLSSKEFIAAVEKSIGAPVITKRFKLGR